MRGRCAAPAFACEKSEKNAAVEAIQRSLLSFFSLSQAAEFSKKRCYAG